MKDAAGQVVVNAMAFQQADCCETASAQWMALGDGNQWKLYPSEDCAAIETSYSNGRGTHTYQTNRFTYELNFARWTQKNTQTGKERVLHRASSLPVRIQPAEWKR